MADADVDPVRDALWVYGSLDQHGTALHSAPSLGAITLLNYARENRNSFIKDFLSKALNAHRAADDGQDDEMDVAGRAEIEAMIKAVQ